MMISEEATDIAQQLLQASLAQPQMNDTSVVQGRDPVTTLARPSVDRQVEGLWPPTDLGDTGSPHRMPEDARWRGCGHQLILETQGPHRMPEDARGLLSGLGPVVTLFWRHTQKLLEGPLLRESFLARHRCEAPQTQGSEARALSRGVPGALPRQNVRTLGGGYF